MSARILGFTLCLLTTVLAAGQALAKPPIPERPSADTRIELLMRAARYGDATALAARLADEALAARPVKPEVAAVALERLADLLKTQGRYTEAEAKARKALALIESAYGANDPRLTASLNMLADLALIHNRASEAEALYLRTLALREKSGTPEHKDVAASAAGLADVYANLSDHERAEAYARRALALREMAKPQDPLRLAESLVDLGYIRLNQKDEGEAELLLRRALAIRERHVAPDHIAIVNSLTSLATLYQRRKQFVESEPLFERALDICRRTFGAEHLFTAQVLFAFGTLREDQARLQEAEQLYAQALPIYERTMGERTGGFVNTLFRMGRIQNKAGRVEEAHRAFARALPIHEAVFGESRYLPGLISEHAQMLWSLKRLPEAIAQFERALALGEKLPDHDQLIYVPLVGLASLHYLRGRYEEAEVMVKRAIEVCGRIAPEDVSSMGILRDSLADIYREQGRLAEAEAIYHDVLDQYVRKFGEASEKTAAVVKALAQVSQIEEQFAQSEVYFQRLLAIQTKLYKPDDPRIGATIADRARLLVERALYGEAETEIRRARAIAEVSGDQKLLIDCLKVESFLREELGVYLQAETLMRQALALEEKRHGVGDDETMTTLNNLGGVLFDLGKYEEAADAIRRAMAINQAHAEPTHPLYGTQMANLAAVYQEMGRLDEAMDMIRKALAIFETRPLRQAWILEKLASLHSAYGRYYEAVAVERKAIKTIETINGPDHPTLATSFGNLGAFLHELGYFDEASTVLERGLAILEKQFGVDHVRSVNTLSAIASVRGEQNRMVEAEALHRRVIAIREAAFGPEHPDTALSYSNYAVHLIDTGRPVEAESLMRRARAVFERAFGPEHRRTVLVAANLATAVNKLGRAGEAEALFKETLALREKVYGAAHPDVATSLNNLAAFYGDAKRDEEAVPLLERGVGIVQQSGVGEDHPQEAMVLYNLGSALVNLGRYDAAAPVLERSLAIREKRFGADHPLTANTLNVLAQLREKRDGFRDIYPLSNRATGIILNYLRRESGRPDEARHTNGRTVLGDYAGMFTRHARAAYWLAAEQPERAPALKDEAFALAQWAHQSAAAAALSQMSARIAKGEGALPALVRQRQDLVWRYQALDKLLLGETAKPASNRDAAAEQSMREEVKAIDKTLREIDERLAREFPDYAALANPEPISLAATQALLRDNEALYQLLIGDRATLAFLVTKGDARWLELPVGREKLVEEVEVLRCGLDVSYWSGETADQRARSERCRRSLQRVPTEQGILPFDLERAHGLYKTLLGPFEDLIEGKHLLIVPSGPLTTLPPHVLVGQPIKPELRFSDYGAVAWLGNNHAITVLPSVASLKVSRGTPKGASAPNPFISFANPLLTGQFGADRQAWERQSCTAVDGMADRMHRGASPTDIDEVYTGAIVDLERIRRQTPLPDTAKEACAVGRSLGAGAADIYLGARATETELKALNGKGQLQAYRILHFATHGLVAGETEQLARTRSEPSLLLTPPEKATDDNDGLLTASEVAGLSLNAEAAVLSACNTASTSGAHNAEALSGLARAFLYAGARALMVTHWSVADDAAVALVTNSFAERRQHPEIELAEALRRAMTAGIAAGGYKAHPAWWAPFVVVTAD
jgi:tetratricopeptide (TPR) repeat protein